MKIKYCYTRKSEGSFISTKEMTVKEAKTIFNQKYKNDSDVIKFWLRYFDGWRYRTKSTLKDIKEV